MDESFPTYYAVSFLHIAQNARSMDDVAVPLTQMVSDIQNKFFFFRIVCLLGAKSAAFWISAG